MNKHFFFMFKQIMLYRMRLRVIFLSNTNSIYNETLTDGHSFHQQDEIYLVSWDKSANESSALIFDVFFLFLHSIRNLRINFLFCLMIARVLDSNHNMLNKKINGQETWRTRKICNINIETEALPFKICFSNNVLNMLKHWIK